MNEEKIKKVVIKRNKTRVEFNGSKIAIAIKKAFDNVNRFKEDKDKYMEKDVNKVYLSVINEIKKDTSKESIKIEEIQDIIEEKLVKLGYKEVYEAFSYYRENRTKSRRVFNDERKQHKLLSVLERTTFLQGVYEKDKVSKIETEASLEEYGKLLTEQIAKSHILKKKINSANESGEIKIHNLENLLMGMTEATAIDLENLFKDGFRSGGYKYESPKNISSSLTLTYLSLERLKKEQYGKSGIPYFNRYLGQYILKTFKKEFLKYIRMFLEYSDFISFVAINTIEREIQKLETMNFNLNIFRGHVRDSKKVFELIEFAYKQARNETIRVTTKALEGFIHNLNHHTYNREIDFGIKSPEKDKVSINIVKSKTYEEYLVFKILVNILKKDFKEKNLPYEPNIYISIREEDLKTIKTKTEQLTEKIKQNSANYSEKLTGKKYKLYSEAEIKEKHLDIIVQTFTMLGNKDNFYYVLTNKANENIDQYLMQGVRLGENLVDSKKNDAGGRGILSTTTINLGKIGLNSIGKKYKDFQNALDQTIDIALLQLFDRFDMQCEKSPSDFPFLYGEPVWTDTDKLKPQDRLRKILKHGNINLGITGLYEAAYILTSNENILEVSSNKDIYENALKILKHIRKILDKYSEENNLNVKLYADNKASKQFMEIDKVIYGRVKNITDKKEYYSGINMAPVKSKKDIELKFEYEALMQKYVNGGTVMHLPLENKSIDINEIISTLMNAQKYGAKLIKFENNK